MHPFQICSTETCSDLKVLLIIEVIVLKNIANEEELYAGYGSEVPIL